MRTTVALVILAVPLACSQSKPNDRNSTDACDSQAAAPTSVVLHVKGMIWPHSWVRRVRKALAGLPWVDHNSATANVARGEVAFRIKDGKQLDEAQLLEAFRKVGFPNTTVVRKPK